MIKNNSCVLDYIKLMKPRVMALVVFTSFCGIMLAKQSIHPLIAFVSIICTIGASGAAAAINMWYDKDIDALMHRTKNRPIVTGAINPDDALSFGIILSCISFIIMSLCVNFVSAMLLITALLYYVFIYTIWLKRSHSQNIVIGGVAGAIPPMIGYASVTNNINLESLVLFLIIFLWTPPHSWALAIYRIKDYQNSKIPMLPLVKGYQHTKIQILLYTILTSIATVMPYFLGIAGIYYLILASILNVIFLFMSVNLFNDDYKNTKAKNLFLYSILYLFLIFLGLIIC